MHWHLSPKMPPAAVLPLTPTPADPLHRILADGAQVAGCGVLSDGAVVAFHRAGRILDWRNPARSPPPICSVVRPSLLCAFHCASLYILLLGVKLALSPQQANNTGIADTNPIVLIDAASGTISSSFGRDVGFIIPHGVFVDHSDSIWVTDCGLHQVFKFSRAGELLLTLGTAGGVCARPASSHRPPPWSSHQ